jgi:hypothetical protein
MTTYVWQTPRNEDLIQVQVGAADIVATLAAASTAWGWIGGLDGIKAVFSNFPRIRGMTNLRDLGVELKMQDSICHVITSDGVIFLQDTDKESAFGGHPITQVIGLTICAL